MNTILQQYQVQFSTPLNFVLYNKIITVNSVMSQIIGDHYTIYDANALLSGVNQVINDPNTNEMDFYTDSLQLALITKTVTIIFADSDAYDNDNTIAPSFSIPTTDFQIIVEAWKNYLVASSVAP
jgi:hypothetical protein